MDWQAVTIHPDDDVAVALVPLAAGPVRVRRGDSVVTAALGEAVPMGHKFALRAIPVGAVVRKYGEPIGAATRTIPAGSHVHIHNVRSRRARSATAPA